MNARDYRLTHHLETIELIRYLLDLFLLARLFDFDTGCVPVTVLDWYR